MPYDTPYNRMIARNQQQTDEEYADYHAYSNQNYLRDGSMGDARGNLRLFPKMVQREYYTPIDYSGGITHRNMEGNGGPLGRQFNSIALGEDTRRQHNKSAMYAPVRPFGSGSSGGMRYAREDDRHYSSSESDSSDDEEMSGCGVPGHSKLLKHLSKMKLPKDVHNEVCEWLEEMEKSGRGLEGRGGVWDWIKGAVSKVGDFVKPIAKIAMPLIKTFTPYGKIIGAVSEGAKAFIPGAEEKLAEYGLGYRGNGEVYVPSAERGNRLTDVRSIGNGMFDIDRFAKMRKEQKEKDANKAKYSGMNLEQFNDIGLKKQTERRKQSQIDKINSEGLTTLNPTKEDFDALRKSKDERIKALGSGASGGARVSQATEDRLKRAQVKYQKDMTENAKKREENKKGQEALAREKAVPAPATGSGANMMETNENPLIGVPMRKPGYMKSSGLHFEGSSLGAGGSGGKKRGRPRKVGGSVMGGPSNDPVNRGKITGGRKRGKGDSEDDPELASIFGDMKLNPAQPQPKGQRPKSAPPKTANMGKIKRKASPDAPAEAPAPAGERPIAKARKTGSALFKKKGTFPLETKPGEPLTETQIVTNGKLGQGRRRKGGADNGAKPDPISPLYRKGAVKEKKVPVTTDSSYVPFNPAPETYVDMADSVRLTAQPEKKKSPPPRRPPKNQPGEVLFPHPNTVNSGTVSSGFGASGGKLKTLLHSSSFSGGKKTSPWIAHCKAYASAHGVSYKQAMKDAKASYKK